MNPAGGENPREVFGPLAEEYARFRPRYPDALFDSLAEDMPQLNEAARGRSFLFVEVPDLAAVETVLAGHAIYMPRRSTFYGSEETGFIEPGGHYVTFAQFAKEG